MKVQGSSGAQAAGAGSARRAAAAPGFAPSLGGVAGPAASGPAAAASAVASLDALLMLQEPEGPMQRKKRAMRRAGGLLDRLDSLKLALLGEGDADSALQNLAQAARERRADVEDDPALLDVLDAIETRAAVEIAKQEALCARTRAA